MQQRLHEFDQPSWPRWKTRIAGGMLCASLCGCLLNGPQLVPAPISASQQQFDLLEIVEPGTPRDEAVARLTEAGIEGTFGASGAKSVYYCDIWNRDDGERWLIDVAILFDEAGRVINTRTGESDTVGFASDATPRSSSNVFDDEADGEPAARISASEPKSRASERRTAFVDD